ncbi:MAG: FecR family protein [Deltaproteobacteria bacterium]|nr:FecR family protein [Deltaproteobacteria bacterium]
MACKSAHPHVLFALFLLGCLLAVHPSIAAAISPELLPEDMRNLRIQEEYTPTSFKMAGTIHSLEGNVVVLHRSTREAYLGSEGDPVHENDEFYTLPDTRCRLRFTNEDVVSLAPETRFSVDDYTAQEGTGEKTSVFGMVKGKAMFYAMRLFRFKKMRFQVKTPTAVMGVRGTKFGAHVYYVDEKTADSGGIRVADSGRSLGPYLAQAGPGGTPVTVAACGDGSVVVNGITLGPGWTYNSMTGAVTYDPDILAGIQQSAGGPGGGGGAGAGAGGGDEGGDEGGFTGYGDDLSDTLSNITNTETGIGTQEGSGGGEEPAPEMTEYGYFATLLKYSDDGEVLRDVFLTRTPNEFAEGAEHRADSILDSDYLIWDNGAYTYVTVDGAGNSISVTTTASVTDSGLSYLAYGQWAQSGTFNSGGLDHYFVDSGWWLQGLATPEVAIAAQTGSVPYSGAAHGTMFYDGVSAILAGAFSATANFDTAHIEDFTLAVTGSAPHAAAISGAGGEIASDGTFDLSGGVWTMTYPDGILSADHKEGHGRFFGPNAEEIGGDWAMKAYDTFFSEHVGVVGVFGGNRP